MGCRLYWGTLMGTTPADFGGFGAVGVTLGEYNWEFTNRFLLDLADLIRLLCFPGPIESTPGVAVALVEFGFDTLKLVKMKPALVTFCLETGRLDRAVADFWELGTGEVEGLLGGLGGEWVTDSSVIGLDGIVSL